ncbi:MAG: anaerobic ribonucleoside-triphosphate reductase [Holosporaceae bacterium]|jgi:anaerobic ribonucleoside-triphosphate reductase|nr:anaerobic ribonucleoside-triphosphate reductase [Holosporaceae bacterium]
MNNEKLRDEERNRCECWTRVMGYHRPVDDFNVGKRGEHAERVHFEEKLTCKDCDSDTE